MRCLMPSAPHGTRAAIYPTLLACWQRFQSERPSIRECPNQESSPTLDISKQMSHRSHAGFERHCHGRRYLEYKPLQDTKYNDSGPPEMMGAAVKTPHDLAHMIVPTPSSQRKPYRSPCGPREKVAKHWSYSNKKSRFSLQVQ